MPFRYLEELICETSTFRGRFFLCIPILYMNAYNAESAFFYVWQRDVRELPKKWRSSVMASFKICTSRRNERSSGEISGVRPIDIRITLTTEDGTISDTAPNGCSQESFQTKASLSVSVFALTIVYSFAV